MTPPRWSRWCAYRLCNWCFTPAVCPVCWCRQTQMFYQCDLCWHWCCEACAVEACGNGGGIATLTRRNSDWSATPKLTAQPSSLDLPTFSTRLGSHRWVESASALFYEHGFVVIPGVLYANECEAVLSVCHRVATHAVGPEKFGNRGPGRYSFGVASSSGAL